MSFDPTRYRNTKDGIGSPGDEAATDTTAPWTLVSLVKGLFNLLSGTITVSLPLGGATSALQTTGNNALSSIDGHVDGIEGLLIAVDGHVDGIEGLITSSNVKLDQLHTDATAATPPGTNLIGRSAADATSATGGIASTARMASAGASTNATNVKTTAGRIYNVQGINKAAYDVFLVVYDSAANPPVPGTTTIRKKIPLAASAAFSHSWPVGLSCAAGIGYAFTKLAADADTTVLVAADILQFNMDYS